MSLLRSLGFAIVGIWLVLALCFAAMDVSTLADPVARRAARICSDEPYGTRINMSVEMSDRDCLPRLAARGGLDAVLVGLPMMLGWALFSRRLR